MTVVVIFFLDAGSSDLHTSGAMVGLGVTVFTGAYAVCGPLLAGVAGRRAKMSLTIALTIFAVGNVLTALAPHMWFFLIARAVTGAAAGVYSPLSAAVAARSVPDEQRGRALSVVLAGLAIGTVFGVPVGLLLAEATTWRWTIGLISVVGALSLVGIAAHRGHLDNIPAPSAVDRLRTMTRPANFATVLVTLFTGVASLGLYTYMHPILTDISQDHRTTALIWVWGVGGAIGAFTIGRVLDKTVSSKIVTLVIVIALFVDLFVLQLGGGLVVAAVTIFLWGLLGWSSMAPQQHTLLAANPHDGSTAVAANASANYLGSAIGSAAGSVALAAGGSENLVLLGLIPLAVAIIIQIFRVGFILNPLRMIVRDWRSRSDAASPDD